MSKVLFVVSENDVNTTINDKISKRVQCDFIHIDSILDCIKFPDYKLIVIFLSHLTEAEEVKLWTILQHLGNYPVILSGRREELHKYFDKTPANIVRYIITPVLLSEYINIVSKVLSDCEEGTLKGNSKEIEESVPPKKILIVDDDSVYLRTISNWLKDLFVVSVAKSGLMALQYLGKEKPDLILLDYNMPIHDGIETLQMIRIKDELKDIPVFFLTGVDDKEAIQRAIELKPQGYILKTVKQEQLIEKIEQFI